MMICCMKEMFCCLSAQEAQDLAWACLTLLLPHLHPVHLQSLINRSSLRLRKSRWNPPSLPRWETSIRPPSLTWSRWLMTSPPSTATPTCSTKANLERGLELCPRYSKQFGSFCLPLIQQCLILLQNGEQPEEEDQEGQGEGEEDKRVAELWFAVSGFTASTPSSPIDSSLLMLIICMYESQ